jgi:peptidyl-prolyl cis-trans isomerase D
MAIMTRMRDSMPVILIGLVVAFLLTIVFEWGMDYLGLSSQRYDHVGKINGRVVTFQEFTELVRQASENQKAQTNIEPDESQLEQIRDQVWNSLVTETLVQEEIARMGITVSDQEIVDWVHGANPPEFLRRQFIDSLGQFNRMAYESAIQNPQNKEVWITVERMLRQQRLQEKFQSVLFASVRPTESEVFQRFADQNTRVEAEYILFDPYRMVKDEEVTVTDVDLKKYYNEHSDEFKIEASRRLKYVLFREEPSAQDTVDVIADLEDLVKRAKEGADFAEVAGLYGTVQNTGAFFRRGELTPVKEEALFDAKAGDIVGPIVDSDGFHVIKILEFRQGSDEFARASHILISIDGEDSAAALKTAREVLRMAQSGESFEHLAEQYSKDPGSAVRGGDLGWFGKGRMVKPFEDAVFKARAGQIVGPVRTQFGYHVIKVVAKSNREVKIASLGIPVKAGSQTRSSILQRAQDFAYIAREDGFQEAADQLGVTVLETPVFNKGGAIPGIGQSESIARFAFDGKIGQTSEVMNLPYGYGVFMVSEARAAGIRPFEEVKEMIQPRVLRSKKMEQLRTIVEEARKMLGPGDTLAKITQTHPDIVVQKTGLFAPSGSVPGIGRDPSVLGILATLKEGEISRPVEGIRGWTIIRLLSRTEVDSAMYQAQRKSLFSQLEQEKRNQFVSQWLEDLRKRATIEDNRDMFFR